MWNALRVLLHRPLLADSHLQLSSPTSSKASFAACSEAATNIVRIVRLYDKAFSVRRAPYLISYATYVAATIHVRIAATRNPTSEAHECLRTCFFVFNSNSETNYAVRKASVVVEALCRRMGLSIEDLGSDSNESIVGNNIAPGPDATMHQGVPNAGDGNTMISELPTESGGPTMVEGQFVPDLDVDAIIHSFMQDQQMHTFATGVISTQNMNVHNTTNQNGNIAYTGQEAYENTGYTTLDDALFGFNASAFDWLYPNTMS